MLEREFEVSSDMRSDQAEGLRRLLGRSSGRVIALESGGRGVGKTSVAINLAAALASRGLQVLLMDANSGFANVSAQLGLRPRFDLRDALTGKCSLDDTLLHGPAGVMVLPAFAALRDGQSVRERERFDATMTQLSPRFDYILIDTCAEGYAVNLLREITDESIVVSAGGASAITATYALIKRMHTQQPQQRLHVLLNRMAGERSAGVIFDNLRRVARVHLQATLESLGHLPGDAQLQRAAEKNQSVVEQFPAAASVAGLHKIAASVVAGSQPAAARAPAPARAPVQMSRPPVFSSYAISPLGA